MLPVVRDSSPELLLHHVISISILATISHRLYSSRRKPINPCSPSVLNDSPPFQNIISMRCKITLLNTHVFRDMCTTNEIDTRTSFQRLNWSRPTFPRSKNKKNESNLLSLSINPIFVTIQCIRRTAGTEFLYAKLPPEDKQEQYTIVKTCVSLAFLVYTSNTIWEWVIQTMSLGQLPWRQTL